jgi:TetR/AcrR family transcriptional regulator, repressor of fatR-cypB operon
MKPLPFFVREDDPPARREILVSALKLFSRKGLAGTTVRDIAEKTGFTNPALYRHFASKDEVALYLFEAAHTRLYDSIDAAVGRAKSRDKRLDAYVGRVLDLLDECPEALVFLHDHGGELFPRASLHVRERSLVGQARALAVACSEGGKEGGPPDPDIVAACIIGTLGQFARMLSLGVLPGPASRWKNDLVSTFARITG